MMSPDTMVGVDALTVTAMGGIEMLSIVGALKELNDIEESEPVKQFVYQGARGFSRGSVRYAEKLTKTDKRQWAILMVTGPISSKVLKYLHFGGKATRIDLRVDVKMSQCVPDLASRYYKFMGGMNSNARMIQSMLGETLYPQESREATYYGRLYDKSAEYGEEIGNVWRFETEVKKDAARQLASIALECHDLEKFIEDTVFGIFKEKWGLPTPKPGVKPKLNYVGFNAITNEQKLDWLRRNVAPTVKGLTKVGLGELVQEMFGFDLPTESDTV